MNERLNGMVAENRRTIDLLEGLRPTKPEDIAERDRQLSTANKLKALLANVATLPGAQ